MAAPSAELVRKLQIAKEAAQGISNPLLSAMWLEGLECKIYKGDSTLLDFMAQLERVPVGIEEFLDSPEFMGSTDLEMWPEVRKTIVEINRNWWKDGGEYDEGIFAGSTRSGKTTVSQVTLLYRLYLFSCLKNPQKLYGLPSATTIVFSIFGAKPAVTKKVVYVPMRKWVEHIPYFKEHMPVDPLIESEMIFRQKNIRISPVGADIDAVLGSALAGFLIDEINFMQVVLKSKRAEVTAGRAGIFDQAANLYETASRRVQGTFIYNGPRIPFRIASSSTRYKGDFTDKRMKQIRDLGQKKSYIYCPKQYEARPAKYYCGETFRLLVGNEILNDTRILKDDEVVREGAQIENVPIEYKDDFLRDPHNALRDVIGISNSAVRPFIRQRWKVMQCVEAWKEQRMESFLVKDHVVLGVDGMPMVKRGHYCSNPSRPRYVHIDLALTGDRVGISMVKYEGLKECSRAEGHVERLPLVSIEMLCTIEPDSQNPIDIAEVRAFVKNLRDIYGYPIKAVSYDTYASQESVQQWRKMGMKCGFQSVDKTPAPYLQFRDAINDGRVLVPDDQLLLDELFNLEEDELTGKVDHCSQFGKDASDACVGAFTTLINRRSSWIDAMMDDEAAVHSLRPDPGERHDGDRPI